MEQKIVILGNGFDLRHFLPTSYNHLILILSEIEKLPENKNTITFSDLFGNLFKKNDERFYQKIIEYYQTDNFVFDLKAIQSLRTRLKVNSWFQYFKSVDENKIETWIDFETEIERILLSVLEYFESFNRNEFKKPRYEGKDGKANFFVPIALEKEHFKSKLQISLLKSFGLFQQIESNLNVIQKFILNIGNEIQYYKERDFFNHLYSSLEEFIGIFNDYISNIVNVFYQNFKVDKRENFIKNGSNFLFGNVNKIYSFNYTSTYNKLYENENQLLKKVAAKFINEDIIGDIDFIHGKANENWSNNFDDLKIVLGVDDIHDSLKKHKLFQFTKYFQKLHKQTDYLFLEEYQKDSTVVKNMKKYVFYFWGHSLDYSDRQYIREIFQFLEYDNNNKIKIFYHSISAKGDQLRNLLAIIPKEIIESHMKAKKLEFIESSAENLFNEL